MSFREALQIAFGLFLMVIMLCLLILIGGYLFELAALLHPVFGIFVAGVGWIFGLAIMIYSIDWISDTYL